MDLAQPPVVAVQRRPEADVPREGWPVGIPAVAQLLGEGPPPLLA